MQVVAKWFVTNDECENTHNPMSLEDVVLSMRPHEVMRVMHLGSDYNFVEIEMPNEGGSRLIWVYAIEA